MEDLKKSDKSVMDQWKKYLRTDGNANADTLFEMIKKAIMVAASDYPNEFLIKRDQIAQTLFSIDCCSSHDHVEEQENIQSMKVSDDPNINNHHWDPNSSHDETLVGEHQEQTEMEVLRIKQILDTDESESVVYESLLKLEQMGMSYEILDVTKIGRSVSTFQNQGSREVRLIATRLIKMWRAVVDEWKEKQEDEEEKKQKEESIIKAKVAEKKQMDSTCTGMMIKKESSTTTSCTNVVKIKIINRNSEKKAAKMEEKSSSINIEKKLEATKRKLHQRYQEVENAKRQRKIQVVELHQLKKQGLILPKPINQNRRSLKMW